MYMGRSRPARQLSPANPARGLRVRTRRCINARTPETGTNHLEGSFDSFDAKADGDQPTGRGESKTHCYGEGVPTCTILTNPRPNARAAPIPSPKFLPTLPQRDAPARSRLKTVPAA